MRERKHSFIRRAPHIAEAGTTHLPGTLLLNTDPMPDYCPIRSSRSKSSSPPQAATARTKYLTMPGMDWQTLQYPAFQVLWSSISQDDRPAPLHKKRCLQRKAGSKQCDNTQLKDVLSESASSETDLQIPRAGSGPNDSISTSDSRSLPPAVQECQVQSDNEPQHNLHWPSAQLIPGFTCSKLITDTELGCDTPQGADPEQSNASAHVVDMIVSDNVDTSVEEPRNAILHQTEVAALTPSYPTLVHSSVAGCNFELCEQPMQLRQITLSSVDPAWIELFASLESSPISSYPP